MLKITNLLKEIIENLQQIVKSNAEISNQQLEMIDKLDTIRMNVFNTQKNTFALLDKKDKF